MCFDAFKQNFICSRSVIMHKTGKDLGEGTIDHRTHLGPEELMLAEENRTYV